jgi:hypothetical protein
LDVWRWLDVVKVWNERRLCLVDCG